MIHIDEEEFLFLDDSPASTNRIDDLLCESCCCVERGRNIENVDFQISDACMFIIYYINKIECFT